MKIETIEIENFRVFQSAKIENIGNVAVFLGENGTGKTTLFDVFGFVRDCLTSNVRSALQACGGYNKVHPKETTGNIRISFKYRPSSKHSLCTYELEIGLDDKKNVRQ